MRLLYGSKKDPSLFVADDGTTPDATATGNTTNADAFTWATWKPAALVDEYKVNRNNKIHQKKFFNHISNFVAQATLCLATYNERYYPWFNNRYAQLANLQRRYCIKAM